MTKGLYAIFILVAVSIFSCNQTTPKDEKTTTKSELGSCESNLPSRFGETTSDLAIKQGKADHKGMVWIKGGSFIMGSADKEGREDEFPRHKVELDGFWIDATEVTNAQFRTFVKETGYITTAERKPDWEEIKKQVPPGTPKPPDSVLVASSLVFSPPNRAVSLNDASQWWSWEKEQIGNTLKVQKAILLEKIITLSFKFHGMTQWPIVNGLESVYQPKPNGNMLLLEV